MTRTLLFPGQGSQTLGMGQDLWDRFPRQVEQADDILGYSIKRLCQDDPNGELNQTQFTQPALYTVCALSYLARVESGEPPPDAAAGHSLGEYAALFAAGAFDFPTGLRLVKRRGGLMAKAQGGGMSAIIGLTAERVAALLARPDYTSVDIANDNSPSQLVISGPLDAVTAAGDMLVQNGALQAIPLRVSAAFHSRAMQPAADAFRRFIDPVEFQPLSFPVIANVTAGPYGVGEVHDLLGKQISSRVRWTESMRYLIAHGTSNFVEVGPGTVLTGLLQQIRRTSTAA